jgi:hypothetical protein
MNDMMGYSRREYNIHAKCWSGSVKSPRRLGNLDEENKLTSINARENALLATVVGRIFYKCDPEFGDRVAKSVPEQ